MFNTNAEGGLWERLIYIMDRGSANMQNRAQHKHNATLEGNPKLLPLAHHRNRGDPTKRGHLGNDDSRRFQIEEMRAGVVSRAQVRGHRDHEHAAAVLGRVRNFVKP